MNFQCPDCGSVKSLRSWSSIFAVCESCQCMGKHEEGWVRLGKMPELPAEDSVLCLGDHGLYQGESFELIGRLRLFWQDGAWNEWCALFAKDRIGWLTETQGFYMLSFALDAIPHLPDFSTIRRGETVDMGRHGLFVVDDCKWALCLASEGELPCLALPEQKLLSIDASDSKGQFLSLEQATDEGQVFLGRYMEIADFSIQKSTARA